MIYLLLRWTELNISLIQSEILTLDEFKFQKIFYEIAS